MAHFSAVLARRNAVSPQTSLSFKVQPKRGPFRRFLDAMMAARQRQADREIARFLQTRGGRLTDDIEREIERRFLRHSSERL
jgi:hypothetical protein